MLAEEKLGVLTLNEKGRNLMISDFLLTLLQEIDMVAHF